MLLAGDFDGKALATLGATSLEDVAAVMSRLRQERHLFDFQAGEDEIVIVMKNDVPAAGVLEFGEEVTFYRRLPVPGIDFLTSPES